MRFQTYHKIDGDSLKIAEYNIIRKKILIPRKLKENVSFVQQI